MRGNLKQHPQRYLIVINRSPLRSNYRSSASGYFKSIIPPPPLGVASAFHRFVKISASYSNTTTSDRAGIKIEGSFVARHSQARAKQVTNSN